MSLSLNLGNPLGDDLGVGALVEYRLVFGRAGQGIASEAASAICEWLASQTYWRLGVGNWPWT